jgi:hypothetical protein
VTLPARLAPLWPVLALLLAGCPLPQVLPEYPSTGTIAPPRILSDQVRPLDSTILVAPDCATTPTFSLFVSLVDENTLETVEARWFVDYDPAQSTRVPYGGPVLIRGPEDGITTTRPVVPEGSPVGAPSFVFEPYGFDDPAFRTGGGLHVVELVVSNGFKGTSAEQLGLPRPWRTPEAQFETQVQRWVFHYAPAGAGGACGFPVP